ncbi:dCMP deaminase [Geosmithia morbida]|uniref:Deoxycytidylate deaminase n=1 Tax=Geosmithia morbida TaxID=1094350 RepID=A0A9P4YYX2_9HYPO|nr:dCMP deaminase [Geosmithia morbida]KAF4124329.1 dCMP deaminase [Geosmithia morbida]
MLVGICGSVCAGKTKVAQYLVEHHGFERLHLVPAEAPGSRHGLATVDGADLPPARNSSDAGSSASPSVFDDPEALLDHVTARWQMRFVTTDLPDESVVDVYSRRPFFLLISIDAPLTVRWRRFLRRQEEQAHPACGDGDGDGAHVAERMSSLEEFVSYNDGYLYDADRGIQAIMSRATVRLLNTSSSLAHLYATLGKLELTDPERLRPGWDSYFMSLASLAAQRSNCMKRRVGCVLVGRGSRVISTGYNGTPRGLRNCNEGGCPRCNDGGCSSGAALSTCLCLHAEENALLEAGRDRIREGAVLYCDTCPCLTCSIKICQVAISEVVYAHGYKRT